MIDSGRTIILFDDPGSENAEILRNLKTLYRTCAGAVPGDRKFGIEQDFVSCPMDVAKNMFALEITEKTQIYEPRAEMTGISFTSDLEGKLTPVIRIGRAEGED